MATNPGQLTLEQQFHLAKVRKEVETLSLVAAQEYVVEIMHQMMVKDNSVKDLLRQP